MRSKNKCHVCDTYFPVQSVAMLHCFEEKTYEDDGEDLFLLWDDGEFYKLPI